MKIFILYPIQDGPHGGANQFLKALRKYWSSKLIYSDDMYNADVILFNLNPGNVYLVKHLIRLKRKSPATKVIARIDGPVFDIRGKGLRFDKFFFKIIQYLCDGVIFQSEWSKNRLIDLGLTLNIPSTVIINGADQKMFYKKPFQELKGKVKLIATSWSSNWKKGFKYYQWLDNNLDFDKYEMTFVGNSPIIFSNIELLPPQNSKELSTLLRSKDIYVTASQKDPCSNSLVEAISCGLPALVLKDGGHPEIIESGGKIFSSFDESILQLKEIRIGYKDYYYALPDRSIESASNKYTEFVYKIKNIVEFNTPKKGKMLLLNYYIKKNMIVDKIIAFKNVLFHFMKL